MRAVAIQLLVPVVLAAIPGWEKYKIKDFCNGTCPSTPDSTGLPHYGQYLFPAMSSDSDGHLYILSAKFGGAYYDFPSLTSYTATGESRWSLSLDQSKLGPQSSYYVEVLKDGIYIVTISAQQTPQGGTQGYIIKVSSEGKELWTKQVPGAPFVTRSGSVYSLDMPDLGKGSFIHKFDADVNPLWTFNDGATKFSYIEMSDTKMCMPAQPQAGSGNFSVVCIDSEKGQWLQTTKVTDSLYERYDLIASAGDNFYVRTWRDNAYMHQGQNALYPIASKAIAEVAPPVNVSSWMVQLPDDIDFVGPITRTSDGSLVVVTRPDCQCRPDSLIAVGVDGKIRWNATLPGKMDISVNPAYPPNFGPWGTSAGVVTSTVSSLHADNKTFDMWYSEVDKDGSLVWKLPVEGITDLTRITYMANAGGDVHVIYDGVLYKVAAKSRASTSSVYV